jgi:hypothetical protein
MVPHERRRHQAIRVVNGVTVPPEWTAKIERDAYANAINSGLSKEDAAFIAATIRAVRAEKKR